MFFLKDEMPCYLESMTHNSAIVGMLWIFFNQGIASSL
jgi:hypothetical protein